jgi:cytochrome c2
MKRTIFVMVLALACARSEAPAPAPAPAAPPPIGDAAKGRQLAAQYGCNVCHVVPGVAGTQGSLAPSLAGVGARAKISNDVVANTPENLAKYIENPPALNPDTTMPAMGITTPEAKDIAAFLLTLK